ncbi:MAG TPA: hypothetical protein PKA27_02150 [Fimbriimonadaceae bacterium]|nr:hypothetical protein [Fimbriimonadaceae bacterium]
MHYKSVIFFATMLALVPDLAQAQQYRVIELDSRTTPTTISKGVVAGYLGSPSHAFQAINSVVADINPLGASTSGVLGRSGSESVGFVSFLGSQSAPAYWIDSVYFALPVPFDFVSGRAIATDGKQIVGSAYEVDVEGTATQHGLLWDRALGTVEDLGQDASVSAVSNGIQVGYQFTSRGTAATMWRNTRNSAVNLHPQFADASIATDTDGVLQLGYVGVDIRVRHEGRPRDIRFYSAGFWTGTADSFQYLFSTYRHSFALALCDDVIVGYGNTTDAIGTPRDSHALAWIGPNHEAVDLHSLLPSKMRTSRAVDVDESGVIIGYGVTQTGQQRSFMWVPKGVAK